MDVDANGIRYMPADYVPSTRFKGKNAIVTAGTLGIGKAIVQRLANDGARVFLCSRKQANVDELVKGLRALGLDVGGCACNVTREGELEKFVKEAIAFFQGGTLHFLVSNVGVNPTFGMTMDTPDSAFDKIFDANVRSHFRLVKLCRPSMSAGGAIVLISSVGGYDPSPPLGIYGASKTALISLGKVLATEFGPDQIRVNTVCPGVIRTKLSEMLWKTEAGKAGASRVDLKRHGEPYEIGNVVAFLCSNEASFLTGEGIVVSGGTHCRL